MITLCSECGRFLTPKNATTNFGNGRVLCRGGCKPQRQANFIKLFDRAKLNKSMKRLADHVDLSRECETITATDFRKRPGEVLEMVQLGKTFVITKAGAALAVLSRAPREILSIKVQPDGSVDYEI